MQTTPAEREAVSSGTIATRKLCSVQYNTLVTRHSSTRVVLARSHFECAPWTLTISPSPDAERMWITSATRVHIASLMVCEENTSPCRNNINRSAHVYAGT